MSKMGRAPSGSGSSSPFLTVTQGDAKYSTVVNHGATAATARPSVTSPVMWVGSVAPTNAIANDVWWDTTVELTKRWSGSTWKPHGAAAYQQVFKPEAYGAVGDGTTDDSTAVQAAIQAAYDAGGGTVYFDSKTYRINSQLTTPTVAGTGIVASKSIRLTGPVSSADYFSSSFTGNSGGAVLDLRYSGSNAKIVAVALGTFAMDNITLTDNGTSTTPFVLTIQAQPRFRDVTVIGNPTKSGATCDQDAFILGGTDFPATTPVNAITGPFYGYGGYVQNCQFRRIRRAVYGRNSVNSMIFRDNIVDPSCGTNLASGAAFELDPGGASTTNYLAHGNLFDGNLIEVVAYVYGFKLVNNCQRNTFVNNSMWDGPAGYLAEVRCEAGTVQNIVLGGGYYDPTKPRLSDAGTNHLIALDQNRPTVRGGLWLGNGTTNGSLSAENAAGTSSGRLVQRNNDQVNLGDVDGAFGANSVIVAASATGVLRFRIGGAAGTDYIILSPTKVQIQQPLEVNNQTTGTTAPGAGGAGALPATPLGYLTVKINGTNRQIAYY